MPREQGCIPLPWTWQKGLPTLTCQGAENQRPGRATGHVLDQAGRHNTFSPISMITSRHILARGQRPTSWATMHLMYLVASTHLPLIVVLAMVSMAIWSFLLPLGIGYPPCADGTMRLGSDLN